MNIKDIADQYLSKVRRSGNENVMALCPFHRKSDGSEEKNPSFSMNVYSGLWHCFSCHASGNLYTFLRDIGIPRAQIDMHFGAVIEDARKHSPVPVSPRDLQGEYAIEGGVLPESLLGLFDYCPLALLEEGYQQELLRKFDIGFDNTHERITFPLRDAEGRLVGISGRTVYPNVKPRYKIYDEEYKKFGLEARRTNKALLLWNMHMVRARLCTADHADRYVVVTEGFKATMRMVQHGVENTVATVGSDVSDIHRWLLESLTSRIYLMYDNNDAGIRGCFRAGQELVKEVPYLLVPSYSVEQPSDLTQEAAVESIQRAVPWIVWCQQHSIQSP